MRQNGETKISLLTVLAISFVCLALPSAYCEETEGESLAEAQAREEIMSSERWLKAKLRFDDWLSIQQVYSEDQIEAIKSELRNRIVTMSASELNAFLPEMENKLAVLMSPASMDARRWASKYTDKALKRIRKQYGSKTRFGCLRWTSKQLCDSSPPIVSQKCPPQRHLIAPEKVRRNQQEASTMRKPRQLPAPLAGLPVPEIDRRVRMPRRAVKVASGLTVLPIPKLNYSVGPWGGVWVNPRR